MNIKDLDKTNICILGFGREGQATLKALKLYAPNARITIADVNPDLDNIPNVNLITGPDYLNHLESFDVIIKTPGISWHPSGALMKKVTSATELFIASLPKEVTVVAVTGSKGKSTTSHLIYTALKADGRQVILAGNIGEPMLAHLSEGRPGTIFVLELSSYQLETMRLSPHIAVITSIFPDHLDYHGSFDAYLEAKRHITQFQQSDDVVFYNQDSPDAHKLADASPGHHIPFQDGDFPGQPIPGLNNPAGRSNLAAAYLVARYLKVPEATAQKALNASQGLPHRQQNLGRHAGIEWIDDSAATTPQSTLSAISSRGSRIDTIIVGGLNRDYDFTELGAALAVSDIRNVILFPDTGALIRNAIESAHPKSSKTYYETKNMTDAVKFAQSRTKAGHICLLSSGSPSYNLFKNFGERGDIFQTAINELGNH